jgi:hypothetical protein
LDPGQEWSASDETRQQLVEWLKLRGKSPRLYPGSLIWCMKKPGRELREKTELWLAWKRVEREIAEGTLGGDFDRFERANIQSEIKTALRAQGLLSESVGAGYIERNWPPALKAHGAWPLLSLRQSFLDGSLTRLMDPDTTLRGKIVEFVGKGDFGLASGQRPDGSYERVWHAE